MHHWRFDHWTRSLVGLSSRRRLLGGLAGTALGLTTSVLPYAASTRKRKTAPKLNSFGCLDVGKACRGNDGRCYSGICKGQQPAKGKKDRSRCISHNERSCQPGEDQCAGNGVQCGITPMGLCYRTTGKAGYCGVSGGCLECLSDSDCVAHGGFGDNAACVVCPDCPGAIRTACFAAAP